MQGKNHPVQVSDRVIPANPEYRSCSQPGLWLCGVRSGSVRLRAKLSHRLSHAIGRASFRFPLVYEFVRELRSFLRRSRTLLFQRSIALADMGPVAGMAANGVPEGID